METPVSASGFVHLHVHSYYSFFDSTLAPCEIVRLAAGQGASAVALTDTNALSGVVEFYKAATAEGIKPLLGAEVRQPEEAVADATATRSVGSGHGAEPADSVSTSLALRPGRTDQRAVLLARNFAGYSAISHLVTRRMLDDRFDLLAECRRLPPDVVVLSDCPPVLEALACNPAAGSPAGLHVFAALMPSRHARRRNRAVYECAARLGLPLVMAADVRIAAPGDAPLHDLLQAMRRLTTIYHLREEDRLDPARHFQSEQAVCAFLRLRNRISQSDDARAFASRFGFSPDPADWVANTVRIAALCDCRLPLGEWKFPRMDPAPGDADAAATLRRLAQEGLGRRYGWPPPEAAVRRLDYELGVITRLQFADYFLLVHRIVAEAHARGFPTLGRGSAANSLVSYALGITDVCPLRHHLYFERFLNPERSAPPDIDVDFAWNQRDDILRWCFEFFGEGHVALIATIATLRTRQAIRETARAMGLGPREVDAFNRLHEIGYCEEDTGRRAWDGTADRPDDGEQDESVGRMGSGVDAVRESLSLARDEPWRTVLAHAGRIAGFPHHFSIHCGGIVISPRPVADYVPLTRSAKGFVITQMDMYGVEDLGLVKIDLLGNRSLAVLGDAVALCEANGRGGGAEAYSEGAAAAPLSACAAGGDAAVFQREAVRMKSPGTRRGTSVALAGVMGIVAAPEASPRGGVAASSDPRPLRERIRDLDAIAADPATRALIHAGDTMGCFYIESPAMRALFERLRCRNFEEVVAASSIIRPGVAESGMMQQYIVRHQSQRVAPPARRQPARAGGACAPAHPLMLRILPETYGVMVYQEDVLRVAHEVAGMALSEADLLRRAMSGKMRSRDAMAAIRDKFLAGARARGLAEDDIAEIWRQMSSFAGYSFCKGHSAAFAVLSFQVAYLKAHHPAEFFAAVLTNGGGFYGPDAYLGEARRRGLSVLPPCVNAAEKHYTGCSGRGSGPAGWVRVGLEAIKGLSGTTLEAILAQRRRAGPYRSLADLICRTGASLGECRALAKAGALDALRAAGAPTDAARQRPALMLEAELLWRAGADGGLGLAGPETLLPEGGAGVAAPWSLRELCRHEAETLGFMLSAHPLDLVEVPPDVVSAAAIRDHAGCRVRMAGWLIAAKLLATKTRRQPMKMLTLEDRSGTFEATLFPRMYERFAPRTLTRGPYLLTGRVDVSLGSPTLNVTGVEILASPLSKS